ncbi:hypothetical protein R1CP_04180 [Rhodococcus opacus]|uniref:Uncharacterized protein n=1 Tax=Rhodococcus opacus TaxID=37919 RepID=A0A1B1JYY2_RHOOP|nr:hypothetical protein R1CP_04180 [Rhodococcus opacus]
MARTQSDAEFHQLRTPRAAAVAGVVFGVLFASSIVLLRSALPGAAATPWLHHQRQITAALILAPFAGIAFLWFIGVIRDRLGDLEDRFFSTVLSCTRLADFLDRSGICAGGSGAGSRNGTLISR